MRPTIERFRLKIQTMSRDKIRAFQERNFCLKFECRKCHREFPSRSDLFKHVKAEHPQDLKHFRPLRSSMRVVLKRLDVRKPTNEPLKCGDGVWAKLAGFPWWPAVVGPDPDRSDSKFFNVHNNLTHVVFVDEGENSRAWVNRLVKYDSASKGEMLMKSDKKYSSRLEVAVEEMEALLKFSKIIRYNQALKGIH